MSDDDDFGFCECCGVNLGDGERELCDQCEFDYSQAGKTSIARLTSCMRPDTVEPGVCLGPTSYAAVSFPLPERPCSTPGMDTELPPEAYDLICAYLAEEISGGRLREILRGKYGWTGPRTEAAVNGAIGRGIRSAVTFGSPSDSGAASDMRATPGSSPTTGADPGLNSPSGAGNNS